MKLRRIEWSEFNVPGWAIEAIDGQLLVTRGGEEEYAEFESQLMTAKGCGVMINAVFFDVPLFKGVVNELVSDC